MSCEYVRVQAFLQARTSSTRLPGKVLRQICGLPMIVHQLKRVLRARLIDRVVVATSAEPSDDGLAALITDLGIPVFRGNLDRLDELTGRSQ